MSQWTPKPTKPPAPECITRVKRWRSKRRADRIMADYRAGAATARANGTFTEYFANWMRRGAQCAD